MSVKTEVWTGEIVRHISTLEKATFLDGVPCYDSYVDGNDVIHLTNMDVEPEVLINNSTYPLPAVALESKDIALKLDRFQTTVSIISDDELYAHSANCISVTRDGHAGAISKSRFTKALHAFAPAKDSPDTPVLITTGPVFQGRKTLTLSDLIRLKNEFDEQEISEEGRRLVLCSDHSLDLSMLSLTSKNFNYESGRVKKLYGFDIYEYGGVPCYNLETKTKKAFGLKRDEKEDVRASVAFYVPNVAKATGSTTIYYSQAKNSPRMQQNEISFRSYSLALPKTQKYLGAIISGKA